MEMIFQVIINGLLIGGFYALVGIGLNVIFGVMKVVNFSQGEFLMLGMYVTYVLNKVFGLDPYLTLPISAALLFMLGAIVQNYLMTPIMRQSGDSNQIFLTVSIMFLLQNASMMIFSADYLAVNTDYGMKGIKLFGSLMTYPKVISFIFVLIITIALFYFLNKTDTGKALRATSQNSYGANLIGINIKRMYVLAFGLGTGLAGIAGSLLVPFYYVFPHIGDTFTPRAFVVVVLGGLGNIPGALIGGLILGLLETAGGFVLGPALKETFVFIIFILILVTRGQIETKKRGLV